MTEPRKFQSSNKVLVVGGGMGGIRAALDLAETGRDVVLVDKAYAIGGLMTQLDRTFPTNNCDLCTLSPHLSESGRQLHIQLMTMSQLSSLDGEAGHFKATLTTQPRYIDLTKCTGCGECARQMPESVRFTPGLDHRAPTCMRYPQGTPYAYSIIKNEQTDFKALAAICPAEAILPGDAETVQEIEVGSVILAPGADVFNPEVLDTYGYGTNPNVVTSLEYERILSASGPTKGELVRPSDSKKPRKIAWIQCVGSRGVQEGLVPYCSSACCMFALKEAIVTRERFSEDMETTVFYMDMRTSGKDYELYLQRAINDYGVRLVRSRPHTVEAVIEAGTPSGDLQIRYFAGAMPPYRRKCSTWWSWPPVSGCRRKPGLWATKPALTSTCTVSPRPGVSPRWPPPGRESMSAGCSRAPRTSRTPWSRPAPPRPTPRRTSPRSGWWPKPR